MNDDDDIDTMMIRILHETMKSYLKAAENAPTEKERQEYLQQVTQTARDVENYYDTMVCTGPELTGETGRTGVAPAAEPVVNRRREAILAQRARNTA